MRLKNMIFACTLVLAACGSNSTAPPPPPPKAPAAPTGLAATGGLGQVSLSWTAVAGATSYNILRGDTAGAETALGTSTAASYTDTGLAAGTTYYYVVQALEGGLSSANSNESSAITIPAAPMGLTGTASGASVILTWTAATGATGYDLRRAPGGTTTFATVGSPTAATFTDPGLPAGTAYTYMVRAKNGSGTSADSLPFNITTAPPAPTGLVVTSVGNAKASLSWAGSSGATGYKVLRSTTAGSGYVVVGTPASSPFNDTGLTNGSTYYYVVRATLSSGESSDAGPVSAAPYRALCVSDQFSNTISVFNAEQTGNVPPLRTFGSITGMVQPSSIAFDTDPAHPEYYVANRRAGTVTVYARTSSGNAAPVRVLSGLQGPTAVAFNRPGDELLVADGATIKGFARTSSGNVAPTRTLQLPAGAVVADIALSGPIGNRMFVVATNKIYVYSAPDFSVPANVITSTAIHTLYSGAYDITKDEILVGDSGTTTGAILAFAAGASGVSTPLRTLSGSLTQFLSPMGLGVDSTNGTLYVVDDSFGAVFAFSLTQFTNTASGNDNVAPTQTLAGPTTQVTGFVHKIAVDASPNKEIAVLSTDGYVLFFPLTANLNIPPTRSISALSTGLDQPGAVRADLVHGELFVANRGQNASVTVYDPTASGDITAKRTLAGPNNTGLSGGVIDLEIDTAHDELFVATGNASIPIFARTATMDVAPKRTITGPNTSLVAVVNVGFDTQADLIVVNDNNQVRTYPRSFSAGAGNEAPLKTISGASTGINAIQGLFVDAVNKEFALADIGAGKVEVFSRTDTGNVSPLRTLTVGKTYSVVVDPVADELFVLSGNVISVYPRTAAGSTTFLRRINGSATGLASGTGFAICN